VNADNQIVKCPATRSALRNIFSVHAPLTETIDLSDVPLIELASDFSLEAYPLPVSSRIALKRMRPSSYSDHINVNYNLAWYFFAEKPLMVRMTAPYFPTSSPADGSILATGEFDIGQWFRPINLDYHIPSSATSFSVTENQPLAFFEFQTTDTIRFQRFMLTPELEQIGYECSESAIRYGQRKTLAQRYRMFSRAGLNKIVSNRISQNLVQ
jgi:hypothetical protein